MTANQKSLLGAFIFGALLFGGSVWWRSYRDNDIKNNSNFIFGKVFKKTGSLKNGNSWHYNFIFEGKSYEDNWSTHVDYDVHLGEYFLINFSSRYPEHNKILYKYKLKVDSHIVKDSVWNTIPYHYVKSGLKPHFNHSQNK